MRWLGLVAIGVAIRFTMSVVWQGIATGSVEFLGRRRRVRGQNPSTYALWLVAALAWGTIVVVPALPLVFS